MTIVFHKPYDVLSQFTKEVDTHKTLADYLTDLPPDVYPIGRLDRDSEGLLLLSNDKHLTDRILNPKNKHEKSYWVQVDNMVSDEAIKRLREGVNIKLKKKVYRTAPAKVMRIDPPNIEDRNPPIRYRKNIPTSWLAITIHEGKNRQVRRMCASVGYPVLRLIRFQIMDITLSSLSPGEYRTLD